MPAREGMHRAQQPRRVPQPPGLETISPELALVDPDLATAARRRLPDPPSPIAAAPVTRPRRRLRRPSRPAVAVGVLTAGALLALATVRIGSAEDAGPAKTKQVAGPGPASPIVGARGQTFTWVASADAAAYEFQLFRGAKRIYRARLEEPRLYLPATSSRNGEAYALTPGSYRWYVWPVLHGAKLPAQAATVSATLTIGGVNR